VVVELTRQIEPCAAGSDPFAKRHKRDGLEQEALMNGWRDQMVDNPADNDGAYAVGWTLSGLAVLGTIVAVWMFGI
jgi:hypothetical protein